MIIIPTFYKTTSGTLAAAEGMEEKKPVVKKKVRAEKYEEKVSFDGTLEQMINMAVKPISNKAKK